MTGGDIAAILVATATLISALASLVVAVRTGQKVQATHDLVDGQTHALLEMTGRSSRAEGIQAGIDQERDRPPS